MTIAATPVTEAHMSIENINTARRLFEEAWSQGKIERFDELCSEGFVDHDPLLGEADR